MLKIVLRWQCHLWADAGADRSWSDDDGTRMHTELTDGSFEFLCIGDELVVEWIIVDGAFQIWILFDSVFDCYAGPGWYHFREHVHLCKWYTESTSDIFHRRTSRECTKCTDLSDLVMAVFLSDIFDYASTSFVREVDVDIGHRYTSRIQESLEEELVPERIDIRDTREIREDGTCCRSSAWTDRDIMLASPSDKVGDDDEISVETHKVDDSKLVF
jgi:hypothetical protein